MITVIIAGGSGTRLWPLSTPSFPKHLLTVTGEESLLQETYHRARRLSGDAIYVVTDVSHVNHVKEQLPDLTEESFIIEPGRRNTASCVIAALHHIQSRHDTAEPIAFLAADHFIRDTEGFEYSFKKAGEVSQELKRQVLIGIEPTYPSTGFGYIKKGTRLEEDALVYEVDSFKEKPDYTVAREFLKSGHFLWNAGYFVGSVEVFLQAMQQHAPELFEQYQRLMATASREDYEATYLAFENVPIDTALNEKVSNLLVVPASFDWMDIGSFKDLHDVVDSDDRGNYAQGSVVLLDTENSFVRNDEPKPLAIIGLDNVAVINTPNGTLVVRKDIAQKVKDAAKLAEAQEG